MWPRNRTESPRAGHAPADGGLPEPIARDFSMSVGDLWRERINRVV